MATAKRASAKKTKKTSRTVKKSGGNAGRNSTGRTRRKAKSVQKTGTSASTSSQSESFDEDTDPREKYLTLGDHLEELRKRLLWIVGIVLLGAAGFGIFSSQIHSILVQPFGEISEYPLIMGKVAGPLVVLIKLSLILSFVTTFPMILLIMWGFITPAVSRKTAWIGSLSVLFSGFLFWGGVAFTWFQLFPLSLEMFFKIMLMGLEKTIPQTSIEEYYSFFFMIHMGAGLLFQIPVLLIALGAAGILTIEWHKKQWRLFITGIFIVSAILTPPDPVTQLVMAGPIISLYVISVLVVWLIERSRRKRGLVDRDLS